MTNSEHAVEYEYGYPSGVRCGMIELRRAQNDIETSIWYIVNTIDQSGYIAKWFDHSHRHLAWRYFRKLACNL